MIHLNPIRLLLINYSPADLKKNLIEFVYFFSAFLNIMISKAK